MNALTNFSNTQLNRTMYVSLYQAYMKFLKNTLFPGTKHGRNLLCLFFCILCFSENSAYAQGNLLVYPRRVVFEGAKHMEEFNLANIGKDTATYQVSLLEMRMKNDGSFEEVTKQDSGQNFAAPFLRFFPKLVVLGPNESQVVKVQVTRSSTLPPGEYRSHLYFRAVPLVKAKGESEEPVDPKNISVRITPIFGISIPVIIHAGEMSSSVSIDHVRLSEKNETGAMLEMTFNRQGNSSVYGNIIIEYLSDLNIKTKLIEADGVAIYTPNKLRDIRVQLPHMPGIDYMHGSLKIRYESSSEAKQVKLAETSYLLTR